MPRPKAAEPALEHHRSPPRRGCGDTWDPKPPLSLGAPPGQGELRTRDDAQWCKISAMPPHRNPAQSIIQPQGWGTPVLLCTPTPPLWSNESRRGTPHPPSCTPLCIALAGPRCGVSPGSGGLQLPPPFPAGCCKGRLVLLRPRSCISRLARREVIPGGAGICCLRLCRRRPGGKEKGGAWQLLLFDFLFLPPSRNLCNVPAAPRAAVSHCCRWNVTQSCCSPGRT